MKVIVDGNQNFALEGSPANVLAAVAAANKFLRDRGRAIMSLKADGKDIPYSELNEELGERAVEDVDVLEIESADIGQLVDEALRELEKALPDLPVACRSLAAVFQGESPQDGFEPFQSLAEIWRHVKTRELHVASAINLNLGACELQSKTIENHHEELNRFLEEAAQAMESRDTVLLGDLLEYELAPRADLESEIVALLKQHAGERPAS